MSETFTVESILDRSEWEGQYGKMVTYRLRANGQEVDLNQKPETPAPTEGQEIYGHLEDGKFRKRLKKDKRPDGGGGGAEASSGAPRGKGTWQPEGERDPEKVARITRAHSQEMAVRVLAANEDFNKAPKPQRQEAVKQWADWFDKDIQHAAAAALLKDGMGATEPPVRPAAADGEIVDEDGIPF